MLQVERFLYRAKIQVSETSDKCEGCEQKNRPGRGVDRQHDRRRQTEKNESADKHQRITRRAALDVDGMFGLVFRHPTLNRCDRLLERNVVEMGHPFEIAKTPIDLRIIELVNALGAEFFDI